jgi:hypothetical protein
MELGIGEGEEVEVEVTRCSGIRWIREHEQCSEMRAVTSHDGLDEPSPSLFSRFALHAAQMIY